MIRVMSLSRQSSRSVATTAVLLWVVVCAAGQPLPDRNQSAIASDILADSEITYVESGGIAGRLHQAHFAAKGSRVDVEYRPADPRAVRGTFTGTLEPDKYIELWRDLERFGVWTMTSSAKSRGADLREYELRLRLGLSRHTVRWDEGNERSDAIRRGAELGRRLLDVARTVTMER
jgi:hypothetical protein